MLVCALVVSARGIKKEVGAIVTKAKGGTLTARQEKFVEHYRISGNATDAAIKAGYSKKTAAVTGHENLRKPNIQKALAEIKQQDAVRNNLSVDWILEGLRKEATRDYEESSGASRVKAYELMGKHVGMWRDSSEQKSDNLTGLVEALKAARVKRGE